MNDTISVDSILSHLTPHLRFVFCSNIFYFPVIDSTNSYAKNSYESTQNKKTSLFIAEEQTAGRGRHGKSFYSPPQTGIYMSILYPLEQDDFFSDVGICTVSCAVATCRAIKKNYNIEAKIKWVNDLFLSEKKICGILCEGILNSKNTKLAAVVIGIGINVTTQDFPHEIKDSAGSLLQKIDRNHLIAQIINELFTLHATACKTEIIQEYRKNSLVIGRRIQVLQGQESFFATAINITDDANLVVENDRGEKRILSSGEISIKL
ncbi:MAG: biotin--[acetyl-CoA-carboxylase] ligase [Treponemataceae bacterium]